MTYPQYFFVGTLCLIAVMSVIAFGTFIKDKKLAVSGKERVKEKTLLTMAALFGSVGALVGRVVAHHKTEKIYFSLVIWFSLILHALLVVYLFWLGFIY